MASLLFLSTMNGLPWGGSEELWSRAAALLAREGHAVTCALFAWPEKRARLQALRSAGCDVRPLPNWGRRKSNPAARLVHEALAKPALELAIRKLPWPCFDHVIVSHGGWNEATWRPFRRLDRLARSYTLLHHSYSEDLPPDRPDDLRRLVLGARQNLFAAHRALEVLTARLGVEPPGAAVFANPLTFVPPSFPPPCDTAHGPVRLAMLGALDFASKAQDVVVEALAREAWRDRDWRLDVYGDGKDRKRLAALVRARGLEGRVDIHGFVADVEGALARAHLVVHPSRVDAMPIVLHEAMGMARPCLVTRVGDMARWIADGETGFVAARPDEEAVARALEAAWAARGRWAEMGRRARERFLATVPADPVRRFADQVLETAAAKAA
jgi:glycosyltransferase involved in cell wall biosynthesis